MPFHICQISGRRVLDRYTFYSVSIVHDLLRRRLAVHTCLLSFSVPLHCFKWLSWPWPDTELISCSTAVPCRRGQSPLQEPMAAHGSPWQPVTGAHGGPWVMITISSSPDWCLHRVTLLIQWIHHQVYLSRNCTLTSSSHAFRLQITGNAQCLAPRISLAEVLFEPFESRNQRRYMWPYDNSVT